MKKVVIKDGLLIRVQKVLMRVKLKNQDIVFEVLNNPDFVEVRHEKEVVTEKK